MYSVCFGKSETLLCERGLTCSIDNIIKILCLFISGLGFIHLAFFFYGLSIKSNIHFWIFFFFFFFFFFFVLSKLNGLDIKNSFTLIQQNKSLFFN